MGLRTREQEQANLRGGQLPFPCRKSGGRHHSPSASARSTALQQGFARGGSARNCIHVVLLLVQNPSQNAFSHLCLACVSILDHHYVLDLMARDGHLNLVVETAVRQVAPVGPVSNASKVNMVDKHAAVGMNEVQV